MDVQHYSVVWIHTGQDTHDLRRQNEMETTRSWCGQASERRWLKAWQGNVSTSVTLTEIQLPATINLYRTTHLKRRRRTSSSSSLEAQCMYMMPVSSKETYGGHDDELAKSVTASSFSRKTSHQCDKNLLCYILQFHLQPLTE